MGVSVGCAGCVGELECPGAWLCGGAALRSALPVTLSCRPSASAEADALEREALRALCGMSASSFSGTGATNGVLWVLESV